MHIILTTGRRVNLTDQQVANFRTRANLTDAIMATPGPPPAIPGEPIPSPLGECHPWEGRVDRDGYATYGVKGGNEQAILTAHRLAYVIHRGEQIPAGHQLDHLCRNPPCVNPLHVQAVAPRVNTHRGRGVAVINAAKTHCKRGHVLAGENLKPTKGLGRVCRECHREACRRYRAALRTP